MTQQYKARVGSMPARLLDFLKANPEEELTRADVAQKFDMPTTSVNACLEPAVNGGALVFERNADLDFVYRLPRAGEKPPGRKPATSPWPAVAAPAPAAAPAAPDVLADMARIDALSVDEDVPFVSQRTPGTSKWEPLFKKLTRAGQSLRIPMEWKTPVAAESTKRNAKAKGVKDAPLYRVGNDPSSDHARLWRIT